MHTIAIQVPKSQLVRPGRPTIGVWTTASRPRVNIASDSRDTGLLTGPFAQVSRLANPLVNEVIIALEDKDRWNRQAPVHDKQFTHYFEHPEVSGLLPVLYPDVFPNLAALNKSGAVRADIVAIFLTGIPEGLIPGFTNFTGSAQADLMRLNTSIEPTPQGSVNILGVVGGDLAGFPNGRRIVDDVVTVELRALAGLTFPLVDPTYKVDAAAKAITDGLTNKSVTNRPLRRFPYMGIPYDGYNNPS